MRDVISSLMGNPYPIMRKTEQQQSADYHFFKGPPLQESSFDGLSGKRPSKVWISQEWHFFWKNLTSLCLKNLLHLYWHCDTCFLSIVLDFGKTISLKRDSGVHIPLIISSISQGNLFISPDKCFW